MTAYATLKHVDVSLDLHNLDEETAQKLAALLFTAVNWAREPWAKDLYYAILESGIEMPEEIEEQIEESVHDHVTAQLMHPEGEEEDAG